MLLGWVCIVDDASVIYCCLSLTQQSYSTLATERGQAPCEDDANTNEHFGAHKYKSFHSASKILAADYLF
jgi:hypothetical protein